MEILIPLLVLSVVGVVILLITRGNKKEGYPVLFFPQATQSTTTFTPEEVGTLLLEFYRAWIKHYGMAGADKLWKALNNLFIEWSVERMYGPNQELIAGETYSPRHVKVWQGVRINGSLKVTRTGLLYQLIHVAKLSLQSGKMDGRESLVGLEQDYAKFLDQHKKLIQEVIEETKRRGF